MKHSINHGDYVSLFRGKFNVSCFMGEVFLQTSLGLGNILLIQTPETWLTFMHKDTRQECLEKGVKLYGNKKKYQNYAASLRAHMSKGWKEVVPKYKIPPVTVTKTELIDLFHFLGKFWYYYGFTEFPYTDLAYQQMQETSDPSFRENFKDFEKLKFEGRDFLNAVVFSDGIVSNLINSLSRTFFNDSTTAHHLFFEELIGLFDGKKPDIKTIEERKSGFVLLTVKGNQFKFSGKDAIKIAEKCTTVNNTAVLKGIIANKGKVTGKVTIAPMLIDMKEVSKVALRMEKGNILIAQTTSPELVPLCRKAAAIVADQGGLMSHAAIIAREMNIPCIVGTVNGTIIFKDGDLVEVDADKGMVKKIK